MGVPKFFRYISERYPCLSELARERCIPEFDNLYLDMNGIIHNCSHPDDTNIHFNITEEEMFKDIFNYIDKLLFLIKPQKLFFMAIDGVAPRAKMNQQRSRRFRSAKEAEVLENLANSRGESRQNDRFDSNCITPGTEFMDRLHEALRYFIKYKISSDPLWQKCRVILSGHNSPGEGEHKIMDYIRYLKSQSDFNPTTRHCLYGLDADLIILGLCTHEMHFVILREEVKFGRKTKKASVEGTRFFLLHLGLLREYLELEFDELKQQNPDFNIGKLIDDWVLMGFLVGNDFIPHLPCLHISSNALPLLYNTYKKVYSSLGGNINENGKLNLDRLEKYFAALAEVEFEIFQENHADLKYFEAKQSKNGIDEAFDFDVNEINNENSDNDLAALIESSRQFLEDGFDESDTEQHINDEFENYKRNYYMNKLNKDSSKSGHAKEQAICYITALQWVLDYYYRGVQSWDWYYPHHYAPFISDLKDFKDYEIKFNMGTPFLPFQQLLAVLPAASKKLLPSAYRELMTSATSELIEYYPEDFLTDLNGKQHEWEAVVLIPFIEEKKLLEAMVECDKNLTAIERKRNQHGPMLEYKYHPESQEQISGIYSLKSLCNVFCTEKPFWSKDIAVSSEKTVCVELPNSECIKYFPGFPTMKHLSYKFEIKNARIKVFDYPARSESMILKPEMRQNLDDIVVVAQEFLNQIVYIGWPHLVKTKVIGISNKEKYIDVDGIKDLDPKIFDFYLKPVQEHLSTRMGIEFADYTVLVHVQTYKGTSYICGSQGKVCSTDVWSSSTTAYPAQGVVARISVQNPIENRHRKIEQLFPENSRIFFVGNPYYGSEGVVMNPMLVYECGRLQVNITVLPEPDFAKAKYVQNELEHDYVGLFEAAAKLSIKIDCLARIIGSILIIKGAKRPKSDLPENVSKLNIGLQLRYMKQQEEVAGYARRLDNQWLLSSKAIALVQSYIERFPEVLEYLSKVAGRMEFLFEQDIFPLQVGEKKIEEILAWIKDQDHTKAEKVACGSKTLVKESIENVLEAIEHLKTLPVKTVKLQVKPHLLLKPDVSLPDMYKPKIPIKLFDRVVIVKTTYMVPLGYKGTVVGIYPVTDPNPVRLECIKAVDHFYEVLFDKNIPNGHDIHGIALHRVYKLPESSVLLIYTQDNKKKETFEDSKISINCQNDNPNMAPKPWRSREIETAVNATTWRSKEKETTPNSLSWRSQNKKTTTNALSWRSQDKIANTNSLSNDSCKNIIKENTDVDKAKVSTENEDNFWMPTTNTKLKHTNTIKIMQNPNNSNKNIEPQLTSDSIEPEQCEDGTQLLKSLLGLSADQDEPTSSKVVTTKPQLPQPPTSWRSDAKKLHIMPHNTIWMPPVKMPANMPMENNIFPISTKTRHSAPQYQQHSHSFNYQVNKEQCTPKPQDKSFNLNSLNQQGAFIPLQVSRRTLYNNNQSLNMSSNMPNNSFLHKNVISEGVNNFKLNELSLGADGDGTNTNEKIDVKPSTTQKKPPRTPKIAAKFDNSHAAFL